MNTAFFDVCFALFVSGFFYVEIASFFLIIVIFFGSKEMSKIQVRVLSLSLSRILEYPLDLWEFMDAGGTDIQIFENPVINTINPAMNGQLLP